MNSLGGAGGAERGKVSGPPSASTFCLIGQRASLSIWGENTEIGIEENWAETPDLRDYKLWLGAIWVLM